MTENKVEDGGAIAPYGAELDFQDRLRLVIGDEPTSAFARRAGLSESLLRKYLAGSEPGISRAALIAKAAGVSLDYLAGVVSAERAGALAQIRDAYFEWQTLNELHDVAAPKLFTRAYNARAVELPHWVYAVFPRVDTELVASLRRGDFGEAGGATLKSEFVFVPRYDIQAGAGNGRELHSEQVVDYLAFRREWIRGQGLRPDRLALIQAAGDSMQETINDGDLLLVDLRHADYETPGVYVMRWGNELLAKRVHPHLEGGKVMGFVAHSDNKQYPPLVIGPEYADRFALIGKVVWAGGKL